jgi:hypothetical protein
MQFSLACENRYCVAYAVYALEIVDPYVYDPFSFSYDSQLHDHPIQRPESSIQHAHGEDPWSHVKPWTDFM